MKKIILTVLLLIIGQTALAQTIPTYNKPKQVNKASSSVPNKSKTTVEKTQSSSKVNIEPEMVFVEGGTFNMGSNEAGDEKPIHRVTVSSFKMSKYEITQAQCKVVMKTNPSHFSNCSNCPVEFVSYTDVQDFIEKLNYKTGKQYRLPTEAEWEFAASGGNNSNSYNYSGSATLSKVGWTEENSREKTHHVGKLTPNKLDLYDMTGNVNEWCSDWFDESYYSNSSSFNPKGPVSGTSRVQRGGNFYDSAYFCRVAFRTHQYPGNGSNATGFRLVSTE